MYFYIFDTNKPIINILPKAPMKGYLLTERAHIILSFNFNTQRFSIMKNRLGGKAFTDVHHLALWYLGIRLFDDGFFISDKEKMIFLLKYQWLITEKVVDFPLI
jgi:hypothetical protein